MIHNSFHDRVKEEFNKIPGIPAIQSFNIYFDERCQSYGFKIDGIFLQPGPLTETQRKISELIRKVEGDPDERRKIEG